MVIGIILAVIGCSLYVFSGWTLLSHDCMTFASLSEKWTIVRKVIVFLASGLFLFILGLFIQFGDII